MTTTTTTPGAGECFYLLYVSEETKGQGSELTYIRTQLMKVKAEISTHESTKINGCDH